MTGAKTKPGVDAKREDYLINGAGGELYCCNLTLGRVLNTAKERARTYPRSEIRVYKLVAKVKSEVQEPDVALA